MLKTDIHDDFLRERDRDDPEAHCKIQGKYGTKNTHIYRLHIQENITPNMKSDVSIIYLGCHQQIFPFCLFLPSNLPISKVHYLVSLGSQIKTNS